MRTRNEAKCGVRSAECGTRARNGFRFSLWHQHWLALAILVMVPLRIGFSQTTSTENSLKAVYLFYFAQFVEWPENAFENAQAPIVIGILGEDHLSSSVEEAVAGEAVRGRKLVVKRCASTEEAKKCQILFISRSESARLERIL